MLVESAAGRRAVLIGAVLGAIALGPDRAKASGIDIPENGTLVLARGGTDVSVLDTAYALQFNPAGMTFGEGLDVRVETLMINPGIGYTNAGAAKAITNNAVGSDSNKTAISWGPQVMITYHPPGLKWLAFGAGVWGPPGIQDFRFSNPETGSLTSSTRSSVVNADTQASPGRYFVIAQHNVVFYPSVGVAWRPIPQVSIGGTLQYVVANIGLSTSLQGIPSADAAIIPNGHLNKVTNDIVAAVNTNGIPRLSGILGAVVAPIPDLILSLSFRPMVAIEATGNLGITLGPDISTAGCGTGGQPPQPPNCGVALGTSSGSGSPTATLNIKLPPIVRAGVAYKWRRLSAAAEYVWEGWSVNNSFTLATNAVASGPLISAANPASGGKVAIGTVTIPNNWQNTNSERVGLGYDILRGNDFHHFTLQVNAGFLVDGNAIPSQWQKLPFVTGTMYGPTVGVSVGWHGLAFNTGFAYYIPQTISVANSSIIKPTALPDSAAPVIGDGTYTANLWTFSMGLSYTGLGAPRAED